MAPLYPSPTHDPERQYLSRYSTDTVGLIIHQNGVPVDADGAVTVTMVRDDNSATIGTGPADHPATGIYQIVPTSAETNDPGFYTLTWVFSLGGVAQAEQTNIEVGENAPAYDALSAPLKAVVESVHSVRLGDLFDNDTAGPNLKFYYQTHFGRNRVAQILRIAVGKLNTVAQPHQTYSIDPPNVFPVAQWGALLEQCLYIETLRHLRRSYVEQPMMEGVPLARADRRDYMTRWGEIIQDEEAEFKGMLDSFKIANMGLGGGRALVSGGVYGSYGPTRMSGMAARPRFFARFY